MRKVITLVVLSVVCGYAPARDEWNPTKEYNARIERIPKDERAWPVYFLARDSLNDIGAYQANAGEHPDIIMPGSADDNWDSVAEWLRLPGVRRVAAEYRRAASMEHLGLQITDAADPVQAAVWAKRIPQYEPAAPSENPLLISTLMPHLGILRAATRHLCAEAALAAIEGDQALVLENIRACLAMSNHAVEWPALIGQLVRFAIIAKATELVRWLLDEHTGSLDAEQLAEIAHELTRLTVDEVLAVDGAMDERVFEDLVRRCTDEDGEFDRDRTRVLATHLRDGSTPGVNLNLPGVAGRLRGPAFAALRAYRILPAAAAEVSRRPWSEDLDDATHRYKAALEKIEPPARLLAEIIQPSWSTAIEASARTRILLNATLLSLGLHRHHLRHAAWPATLSDLDADLLEAPPIDAFTGEPLHYKLTDDGPAVYSAGADRDDDDARPLRDADGTITTPRWIPAARIQPTLETDPASIDGDWVLYPPQD